MAEINVITTCANPVDGALLLPQNVAAKSHLVVWGPSKQKHLLNGGNKSDTTGAGACVSGTTFTLLGGKSGATLPVHYRDATTWDILRYKSGVGIQLLLAVLAVATGLITAYLALQTAQTTKGEQTFLLWLSTTLFGLTAISLLLKCKSDVDAALK